MKANICNRPSKQLKSTISRECEKYVNERAEQIKQDTARRTMKMMCVALYDAFDFDSDKCCTVLKEFFKMAEERQEHEETFWWTLDKICMGELNLSDLLEKEDYEVMDK